jgi:hypothetical protein
MGTSDLPGSGASLSPSISSGQELEAKALFEHLAEGRREEIKPGLLRTFQRRVKAWRLKEGPEVFLPGSGASLSPSISSGQVRPETSITVAMRSMMWARWSVSKLVARVYVEGAAEVAQLPLGKSDRGAVIDFRHLIGHLLRKPGAFANYRWREELFPAPVYRAAYDHLERSAPVEADRRYLELLKLAAEEGQTAVENALEHLLGSPRPVVSAAEARAVLDTWNDMRREWRQRPPLEVDFAAYDALLEGADAAEDANGITERTSSRQAAAALTASAEVTHAN